jgi:hypothetical protein
VKNPCPSPDRWQSLLDGTIEDAHHRGLTEHLETCAGCRELLDRLAGQGTTTLAFMEELPPNQVPAELARVLAELKRQSPVARAGRWDIRPFLKPATRPDALGCFGDYEILSVIAQGGMGVVLEAHDPALDRIVAIKVLAPDLAGKEVYRDRFVREARAAAALQHDHIVVIHAVGEEAGLPYIVMQRLAGPSLHDYLARSGPLPPASDIFSLGATLFALAADRIFCIEAFDSPRVELFHCEVVPFERAVGGVFARFKRELNTAAPHVGVLNVEHSLMTGIEAFELENETSRPVQLELARSIFVNRVMVRLDDRVPPNLLSVTASHCVFDVESLLFGATPDPADFGRQFLWVGSNNRFSVRLGFVTMPRQGRPSPMPGYPVAISRWAELEQVTEMGSRSAELHLWDGLLEGGAQANAIRADRVVLSPRLELEDASDLGRIGPGAPYAEWRRSAAYREWEDRLAERVKQNIPKRHFEVLPFVNSDHGRVLAITIRK